MAAVSQVEVQADAQGYQHVARGGIAERPHENLEVGMLR